MKQVKAYSIRVTLFVIQLSTYPNFKEPNMLHQMHQVLQIQYHTIIHHHMSDD